MLEPKLTGIYNFVIKILNKTKQEKALALITNLLDLVQYTLTTNKTPLLDLIPTTPVTYNKNLPQELIQTIAKKIKKNAQRQRKF